MIPSLRSAIHRPPTAVKLPDHQPPAARSSGDDRRLAAVAAIGVACLAGLLYWRTLAPSIAWSHQGADSGELVAAAWTLGVPHPTGYPLFTLLGHLATRQSPGEPAWGMNLLTALCAALAVGVTAWLAGELAGPAGPASRALAAFTTGGLFAVAPRFWSQSILTEVYALAALLLAGVFLALARWRALWSASGGPAAKRWLVLAAFLFGLGLAHQATIALIAPLIILVVVLTARRAILQPGFWRHAVLTLLALAPGLLLYLYLPLAAAANPPVNWGRASTWDGFLWTVLARPYRENTFQWDLVTRDPLGALTLVTTQLSDQFTLALLVIALWGALWLIRRDWLTGSLLVAAAAIFTLNRLTYRTVSIDAYFIPLFQITAIWIGLGWADLARRCQAGFAASGMRVHFVLGSAVLVVMTAGTLINYPIIDLSREMSPRDYGIATLEAMPRSSILLTNRDDRSFSLWYAQYVLGVRPDVALVSPALLVFPWYQEHLRILYPDLRVGDFGDVQGSESIELIRQNIRDNYRPVILGEEMPTVGLSFEVEQDGDLAVVVRDLAETMETMESRETMDTEQ